MNAAYTEAYRRRRAKVLAAFTPDRLFAQGVEPLSDAYALRTKYYELDEAGFHRGSECELLDERGGVLYRYRNIDSDGEFCTPIRLSSGREYLLFRFDLYGYGVLDLRTLSDFFFYPSESLYGDGFEETFIWTAVYLNPLNDVLAVNGCYWGAPYGMILLDFSDPMRETPWLELRERLVSEEDDVVDLNFALWRGTDLVLNVEFPDGARRVVVPEAKYRRWLIEAGA